MPNPPDEKTAAMVREAASLMGKLFISRRDRKAVYRPDHKGKWHWTAVESKYTMDDFVQHLTGEQCLGTYLLGDDSTVKFMAFDIDLNKKASYWPMTDEDVVSLDKAEGDLEAALHITSDPAHRWARIVVSDAVHLIHNAIADWHLKTLTMVTGGGAHVMVLFDEPVPAVEARTAGISIVTDMESAKRLNDNFYSFGGIGDEATIEIFPKQDALDGKKFGNLIRLPFGWHHEAALRTYAVDPATLGQWKWDKIPSLPTLRALAGG